VGGLRVKPYLTGVYIAQRNETVEKRVLKGMVYSTIWLDLDEWMADSKLRSKLRGKIMEMAVLLVGWWGIQAI
jgi:hypothetical protein